MISKYIIYDDVSTSTVHWQTKKVAKEPELTQKKNDTCDIKQYVMVLYD